MENNKNKKYEPNGFQEVVVDSIPFGIYNRTIFKDFNLSPVAKLVFIFMCDKSPDWNYSINGLATCMGIGIRTIRRALGELKEHKYLEIIQVRCENGYLRWKYIIHSNINNTSTVTNSSNQTNVTKKEQQIKMNTNPPSGQNPYCGCEATLTVLELNLDKRDNKDDNYSSSNTNEKNENKNIVKESKEITIEKKKEDHISSKISSVIADDTLEKKSIHNLTKYLINAHYTSNEDSNLLFYDKKIKDLLAAYISAGYTAEDAYNYTKFYIVTFLERLKQYKNQINWKIYNQFNYFSSAIDSLIKEKHNTVVAPVNGPGVPSPTYTNKNYKYDKKGQKISNYEEPEYLIKSIEEYLKQNSTT
jgi:hypothetical protein